jgi:7SK snRNA methylphosphate capping enzyme
MTAATSSATASVANMALPSAFLLGGNIRDPLNLNSLSDERIHRAVNAVTPENSPLPTPKYRKPEYKIEVLIPPNISDPLNLNCNVDERDYEKQLVSPAATGGPARRHHHSRHHRKRNHVSAAVKEALNKEVTSGTQSEPDDLEPEQPREEGQPSTKKARTSALLALDTGSESDSALLAVSARGKSAVDLSAAKAAAKSIPKLASKSQSTSATRASDPKPEGNSVVSQRSNKNSNKHFRPSKSSQRGRGGSQQRGFGAKRGGRGGKKITFQYGNYNRYYGYRNPSGKGDTRLKHFQAEWFTGKDVLDVGCNVGEITTAVAKFFRPRSIVGVDIDRKLIEQARRSVKMCLSCQRPGENDDFPKSLPILYGPLYPPGDGELFNRDEGGEPASKGQIEDNFPRNVQFICGNYVVEDDELLETTQPEFDTILCLSTTKWIHLNFGDDGLKRAFKRMYAQLKPGRMRL